MRTFIHNAVSRPVATLSPAAWNLLAVCAIVAALYQGVSLIAWLPAPPYFRAAFAVCGCFAIACVREAARARPALWRGIGQGSLGAFCLLLVAAILLPVFAKARHGRYRSSPISRLKQIALGYIQYAQDNDERLPPGSSAQARMAIAPYLQPTPSRLWWYKDRGMFVPNSAVSGMSLRDLPAQPDGKSMVVIAYSDWSNRSEGGLQYRYVAFVDGRVETVSEPRFHALLRETARQAVAARARKTRTP